MNHCLRFMPGCWVVDLILGKATSRRRVTAQFSYGFAFLLASLLFAFSIVRLNAATNSGVHCRLVFKACRFARRNNGICFLQSSSFDKSMGLSLGRCGFQQL